MAELWCCHYHISFLVIHKSKLVIIFLTFALDFILELGSIITLNPGICFVPPIRAFAQKFSPPSIKLGQEVTSVCLRPTLNYECKLDRIFMARPFGHRTEYPPLDFLWRPISVAYLRMYAPTRYPICVRW